MVFNKNEYSISHYRENKDKINKERFKRRIAKGTKPNQQLMERYNMTHDDVRRIQEESNIQGIIDTDPITPKKKSINSFTLEDARKCLDAAVSRHEIKITTANNYFNKLRMILKLMESDGDLKILKNYEAVINKIKSHYESTNSRKDMFSAIVSISKHCPSLKIDADKYRNVMLPLIKESEHEQFQNTNDDIVLWSDIMKKARRIEKQYGKYSDENILSKLYTKIYPLRDNFGKIHTAYVEGRFKPEQFIGIRHNVLGEGYLYHNEDMASIILFDYKTSKHYGDVIIDPPRELQNIIIGSLRIRPRDYLFENSYGKAAGKLSPKIKMLFDGYTINDIRHSRITHELRILGKLSMTDAQELSGQMLHSTKMQRLYIRNIDSKNEVKKGIKNNFEASYSQH